MKVLVDSIRSETPRPKSPHMNNEEPIELAHFPAAKPPPPGEPPKIERDDFPAPPYPYTDPERRKRWSDTYKGWFKCLEIISLNNSVTCSYNFC